MSSIKLFRGSFGHVSVLSVEGDLVTHAHMAAHVILWLEGAAGVMTVGHETVRLGSGVAAAINSFQPHCHTFAEDGPAGRFLAFYIDPEWANSRRGRPLNEPVFQSAAIEVDAWLRAAAVSIFEDMDGEGGADDIADYEVERLVDSLLDAADAARSPSRRRSSVRDDYDPRVRKAIDLMQARVCERVSFDAVARSVGLSRPHFFALFKRQTKLTPNVYWNTLRMEEAVRQLNRSHEPLTSVAWNLGFTSQGNFSRFFRDHAGVPPTLYREAARMRA